MKVGWSAAGMLGAIGCFGSPGGTVRIETRPRAHILVDGKYQGTSPRRIDDALPILVFAPGHEPRLLMGDAVTAEPISLRPRRSVRSASAASPDRKRAWDYVVQAISAARAHDCETVRTLATKARGVDPKVETSVFQRETTIAPCLAERQPGEAPAATP